MRHRLSLLPLLLAAVLAFAVAPSMAGASSKSIISDCTDGTIDGTYTTKELQKALDSLEANLSDYSECSDAIYAALNAVGTKKTSSGSSGGAAGGTTGGGAAAGSGGAGSSGTTGATRAADSIGAGGSGASASTDGEEASAAATDARNASLQEKNAALVAATQAAQRDAGARAADLKDAAVPAAALQLGASDTAVPLPLLLTLIACAAAACIAGGTSGVQALRRRRGR